MKLSFFTVLIVAIGLISCDSKMLEDTLDEIMGGGGLSNDQIASGLKEALNKGVHTGVASLSKTNGYFSSPYKILLPKEAQDVVRTLSKVPGFNNVENEIITKVNRAAEDAAKKATPIFASAIRQMSFSDVMGILKGNNNAATSYLERTTSSKLYSEFNPVIVNSLNKYNVLDYWEDAVKAYNKIPLVNKMNPRLDDHITNKALDGLFKMVAKEELNIRTNLRARTSDLLKKVFALQD